MPSSYAWLPVSSSGENAAVGSKRRMRGGGHASQSSPCVRRVDDPGRDRTVRAGAAGTPSVHPDRVCGPETRPATLCPS